jgi:glycosyltransferase involved in cell wall biosynthesis
MGSPTISLVIATIGRPTLARALRSVRVQDWRPQDEILLVGDGPQPVASELWDQFRLPGRFVEVPGPNKDWGHTPRNLVVPLARGAYLMALDDDDEMTPDAVAVVRKALAETPNRPHLFRMSGVPTVGTVWKVKEIREGNVGTPMLVCPNDPARLGRYAPRYGGDFDFIRDTCAFYPEGPVWHQTVICRVRPPR